MEIAAAQTLTPEEQKIRDDAIAYAKAQKRLRCRALCSPSIYPAEEFPVSVFMAGSPGAGKTESAKEIISQVPSRSGKELVSRL
jgi:UDP-N-acetylglucosamine kinase